MIKHGLRLLAGVLAAAPVLAGSAHAASDGLTVYNTNCSVCHQAGGAGMPGQFPVLKNRIDKIAATPEGKKYLMDVVLNGLHGPIQAGGAAYAGFMPSLKALSDDDIAAVLTYVASLGDTSPAPTITADDVKAARATPKKGPEVQAERNALNAAHPIP
ncbi:MULTISPECIES: cytochrome c [Acetobacter]|uniref:Cytochrome c n=1 Tax=Acetobacter cerevisiae TaxID=178900 RepID=A0A149UTE0_9PROT|nr:MULTISPECIES: cytochrome c [Acetobacter]KXV71036.1 disulfide bond formation protein DsbD [Acetobacter cerevisiae]MCP1246410.1 cytochrome c [Acetobacter cerevisiae]MCP1255950.1 cytochrome c [Acetobacter cerevisiae]